MHLTYFLSHALLLTNTAASVLRRRQEVQDPYLTNTHAAIARLQQFYNQPSPGFWSKGWWNSGVCFMSLTDLRMQDESDFIKSVTDGPDGVLYRTLNTQQKDKMGAFSYTNFFDDYLWWAIGLMTAYDITQDEAFLSAAGATFERTRRDDTPHPCGGLWNAYPGEANRGSSSITSLLFVEAAAMLATRYPQKEYYVNLANQQWEWINAHFLIDGMIAGDSLRDEPRCWNRKEYLTYLQGVAISGLTLMAQATGNETYLTTADTIASTTVSGKNGLVKNGIAIDSCDVNNGCNPDVAQFKGIFTRGLRMLNAAKPTAAFGQIPGFLKSNADSIWDKSRGKDNLLSMSWTGPFNQSSDQAVELASHSSATMALVSAALLPDDDSLAAGFIGG